MENSVVCNRVKQVGIKASNTASQNGMYLCISLGLVLLYDICKKAMKYDYAVKISAHEDGVKEFKFSKNADENSNS